MFKPVRPAQSITSFEDVPLQLALLAEDLGAETDAGEGLNDRCSQFVVAFAVSFKV